MSDRDTKASTTHTPGPLLASRGHEDEPDRWVVLTASPPHAHNYLVAVIENGAPGDSLLTEGQNAHLFAAAPELLAALELADYELKRLQECIEYLGAGIALGNTVAVRDTVGAAIAKARGGATADTKSPDAGGRGGARPLASPMDMSDAEVVAEMQSGSLLNRVRQAVSDFVASSEQAGQQRRVPTICDVRRAEFCAARNLITIINSDHAEREAEVVRLRVQIGQSDEAVTHLGATIKRLSEELWVARETAAQAVLRLDVLVDACIAYRNVTSDDYDFKARKIELDQAVAMGARVVEEQRGQAQPRRDDAHAPGLDPVHDVRDEHAPRSVTPACDTLDEATHRDSFGGRR